MKDNKVVELFKKFMDNPLLFGIVVSAGFIGIMKLLGLILSPILKPLNIGPNAEAIYELILIIIWVGLYTWYRIGYKKEVPHTLSVKSFFKGIQLLLPMLIMAALLFVGTMLAALTGAKKMPEASYILRTFVSALEAGVCEDIAIRGLFAGNAMRVKHEPKDVIKYAILSSVAFGLVHLINLVSGASVPETISQVLYAAGFGMILCAAFYRTGTVLPCVIVHFLFDFFQMMSMAIMEGESDKIGVLTGSGEGGAADGLIKIAYGLGILVVFGAIGLYHLRKKKRDAVVSIFKV